MTRAPETLTGLVAERVGSGRPLTYRAFESKAVDPETGYRPSHSTLWKLARGEDVKPSPVLVRALAAGLGVPLTRVAAAAAYQYTGYVATPLGEAVVVGELGAGDAPLAREVLAEWAAEDAEADDPAE